MQRTVHTPELDMAVVACRHNQGQVVVKIGPVHTAVMALKDVLCVCVWGKKPKKPRVS